MTSRSRWTYVPGNISSYCEPCDKLGHSKRKAAKAAARQSYEPGMREYRCPAVEGRWHIGHTPDAVRAGLMTVDEYYALDVRNRPGYDPKHRRRRK